MSNHSVLTNFSSLHPYSYKEAFNDTLFYLDSLKLQTNPYAIINQGIHKMNVERTFEQVAYAKHNMRINNLIELPDYIFISYKCMCNGNNKTHTAVYDKKKQTFLNLRDENGEEKITNDFYPGLNIKLLSVVNKNKTLSLRVFVLKLSPQDTSLFTNPETRKIYINFHSLPVSHFPSANIRDLKLVLSTLKNNIPD